MRRPGEAISELLGKLRAEGIAADIDPDRLSTDPVCVWVQPRDVRDYTLAGGATLVCWLYLIVANTEPARAMELLDDALENVLALVEVSSADDDVIDLTAAVILPGNSSAPLPAYRLAIDLDLGDTAP